MAARGAGPIPLYNKYRKLKKVFFSKTTGQIWIIVYRNNTDFYMILISVSFFIRWRILFAMATNWKLIWKSSSVKPLARFEYYTNMVCWWPWSWSTLFYEFLLFQKLLKQIQPISNMSFNIQPGERWRAIMALLFKFCLCFQVASEILQKHLDQWPQQKPVGPREPELGLSPVRLPSVQQYVLDPAGSKVTRDVTVLLNLLESREAR